MKTYTKVTDGIIATEDPQADARRAQAIETAKLSGILMTISAADVGPFIEGYIQDLATAKEAFKSIAYMVIAIRDYIASGWPDE